MQRCKNSFGGPLSLGGHQSLLGGPWNQLGGSRSQLREPRASWEAHGTGKMEKQEKNVNNGDKSPL